MSDSTLPRANPRAKPPIVRSLRCAACGSRVDVKTPLSWRCPNAKGNDRHHVLLIESDVAPLRRTKHKNPFIAFRRYLAWDAFADANGMSEDDRDALIEELDAKIASVAGTGFVFTPFARADKLSDALGFSQNGGVWVKDETHNVAGSQKSRHLFTELLHLVAAERLGLAPWSSASGSSSGTATNPRPPLAIASCGNAAFAASTLAHALKWPIQVFVPEHADAVLVQRLRDLGADVVHCPRRADDPPGDPCVHRFREDGVRRRTHGASAYRATVRAGGWGEHLRRASPKVSTPAALAPRCTPFRQKAAHRSHARGRRARNTRPQSTLRLTGASA